MTYKTKEISVETIQVQRQNESIEMISSDRYPGLQVQRKVAYPQANGIYEVWKVSGSDEDVTLPFIEHHNTFCSVLVTKGSMEVKVGNESSTADYGSILHMLPYTPHSMSINKNTEFFVIYAGENIKDGLDSDLHDPGELASLPWAPPEIGEVRKKDDYIEHFRLAPFYYMTNKISPNETGGLYQLEFLNIEISKNMPPGKPMLWDQHFHHNHCETFLVLEGSAVIGNENGKLFTLKPGDLCQCPVHAHHTLMVKEDSFIAAICNPPDYQMKINQMKTMMKYHSNMMFEPDFFDFQDKWDRQFEHHGLSKEYKGIIEAVDGNMLKINTDGKIHDVDMSTNLYMLNAEVGSKVKFYGFPDENGTVIGWKAWEI